MEFRNKHWLSSLSNTCSSQSSDGCGEKQWNKSEFSMNGTNLDSKESWDSLTQASELSRSDSSVSNLEKNQMEHIEINAISGVTILNKLTLETHIETFINYNLRTPQLSKSKTKCKMIKSWNTSVTRKSLKNTKLKMLPNQLKFKLNKDESNNESDIIPDMLLNSQMKPKEFDFSNITPKFNVSI